MELGSYRTLGDIKTLTADISQDLKALEKRQDEEMIELLEYIRSRFAGSYWHSIKNRELLQQFKEQ